MRKAAVLLLFFAGSASASFWPRFTTETIQLHPGEHVAIDVIATWSGLVNMNPNYDWGFASNNERVATVTGHLAAPDREARVAIQANGPGSASILVTYASSSVTSPTVVTVNVVCGAEVPVTPERAVIMTYVGQETTLRAISDATARLQWYAGRAGDPSQPLDSAGAELRFTPTRAGAQYVWVSARTSCSESRAEFRIDAVAPRRRASRP